MTAAPTRPSHTYPAWWADGVSDQISLPAGPITTGIARHFVQQTMATWSVPGDIADALVLIASELATNAIAHTGTTTYTVACIRGPHSVELCVSNADGNSQIPLRNADDQDDSGWGLAMLAHLATTWGISRHRDGTRTWARVHLSSAEPRCRYDPPPGGEERRHWTSVR
ncbi:ATP-binding protein [Streptomyces sp. DSM 42041]|uniref:ATP-binding protein n=1 Tax=Streptomyces hazeniae TaxID=3075538 RepID=A0ABU2P324_9ACTN|nr:ATP-binding protein [Streptomyces sp. DSM 42041]MDT0382592.1 ATP-binding protein [Streptomyces sp. DSM 42041]